MCSTLLLYVFYVTRSLKREREREREGEREKTERERERERGMGQPRPSNDVREEKVVSNPLKLTREVRQPPVTALRWVYRNIPLRTVRSAAEGHKTPTTYKPLRQRHFLTARRGRNNTSLESGVRGPLRTVRSVAECPGRPLGQSEASPNALGLLKNTLS